MPCSSSPLPEADAPDRDCALCPRLAAFRAENRQKFPDRFNAPVPSFGSPEASLLIVGLAPGLKGANFTGRPFTGDYAGLLLYKALSVYGFAKGEYKARPDDGLSLISARIVNAVRCVPPQNLPTPEEERTCSRFLHREMTDMKNLRAVLALGRVAHQAVLRVNGIPLKLFPFQHGKKSVLPVACPQGSGTLTLFDSYHVSRLNTSTKRLTEEMFMSLVAEIKQFLEKE